MWVRVFNIVCTLLLLCLFDGFVFRDPDYELPAGYRLSAISNSSPAMVVCTKFNTLTDSAATTAKQSFTFTGPGDCFDGITDWACDRKHLIGQTDSGWFVLEFSARRVDLFDDIATWERELVARTELRPSSLNEPSSAVRSRPKGILVIYSIVLLCGVIPNLIPSRTTQVVDLGG